MIPASRRVVDTNGVPDEALMGRYADGDAMAFDELFRRYEGRVFSFFLKRTRSRERSQDLYQELFLRIHRARGSYDAARAFSPWLFQIARRLLVDDQRRAFRSREVADSERGADSNPPVARDDVAEREEITQILGTLSAQERYVLVSAKVEGITYPELAARLGKSADAVKQLASRALRRLRAAVPSVVAEIGEASR